MSAGTAGILASAKMDAGVPGCMGLFELWLREGACLI